MSGRQCTRISQATRTWKALSSIVRWCERMLVRPAHPKNEEPEEPEEQALGRSRGGFSTKIHVTVDALGNPLRFILTGGECHDMTQAEALIAGLTFEIAIGDKAYDAETFRQKIADKGAKAVIPERGKCK